ncbi:glutathione S-transferase U8 [Vitis vinifera]|uniref:glutathione transferase n=2 Tax=Vitis vinifera TaxID=29760 RepID=A5BVL9_VITVI|nr:glutathione S-transferase U8 [Vitis vinifera]CAN63896.1 hypothetical protein VITISV_041660 [Vitis vinifera]|eukprot:XP_002275435.3 PREDICTED: glutathione S-transferase U8 [Vitis vinifera]
MAEEVKLIGMWGSPFSRRVEIALKLKGVQYEYIDVDLTNKSPLLLKSNPVHKKVPVLLHNGKPIAESLVILEYIDETWKANPILPQHPYDRAMARFWAKYIDEKCLPALWNACWCEKKDREKAVEEANVGLETLENELKDKKFFGGESIGFVDIAANFIGFWVGVLEEVVGVELLTIDKFPILCKWRDEYVGCSGIKENLPSKEKLGAYFRTRVESASQSE